MIAKLDSMVIASAFPDHLPGAAIGEGTLGAALDPRSAHAWSQAITDRGVDFVVQEAVTLSTMPVWHDGRLEPRPFILRLFLAAAATAGPSCRAASCASPTIVDARAVSLQRGGRTADAWVLSEGPVAETTLLPTPERIAIHRATGVLPSRAADNLFWVGRYVERAEATLRLVRALINRIAEAGEEDAPVIERIGSLLESWDAGSSDIPHARPALIAGSAARGDFDGSLPNLVRPRACGGLGDPRPLFARCLARAQRSGGRHRRAAARGLSGNRDVRPGRRGAAHHLVVLRPRAGEHDPARRLAVSGARPPHRARDRDLPVRAPVRRPGRSRTARSTCCSSFATARSPTGSAT